MEYILKTIGYYALILIIYFFLERKYRKYNEKKSKKITYIQIIIIAALIGIYSVFCYAPGYVGDHHYYMNRFVNYYSILNDSPGLNAIYIFLHSFTNNPNVLFAFVNGITTFILLLIYKRWEEFTPRTLLLVLLSEYFLYGFQVMKQVFANVFSTLFLMLYLKNKKIISTVFIILACLFHEVAYILIFVYISLLLSNKSFFRRGIYLLVPIIILLYIPFTTMGMKLINSYFPGLLNQIKMYLTAGGELITTNNILTIFKGLPFYIITIVGIKNRQVFKSKIKNYDCYLTISVICSLFMTLSFYMYWSFRFSLLLYIPVLVFAENMETLLGKSKIIFKICTFYAIIALGLKYMIQMFFLYGGL